MPGPLDGYRIIELGGIGPGPFGGMMLADMGADVIRIDRVQASPAAPAVPSMDLLNRGRRSVAIDLKHPEGIGAVLLLVERADGLIEGFRPGVAERLGVGPDECQARNPRLVYGRMTGWGQDGPLAQVPGHDINYLALSGVLGAIGRAGQPPVPPINLLGDFGGGGMLLAFGMVCGLLEAGRSGRGQVIDAAMVDGAALLATMIHGLRAAGFWAGERGTNLLDTGAWFYEVYETADGGHVSLGSLEPKFFTELVRLSGLGDGPRADGLGPVPEQMDRASWPAMKERMAALIRSRTLGEWCARMEGTDVCFAPVLGLADAATHPHNAHRGTFTTFAGVTQPAPAPRFSRTPGSITRPPPHPGQHSDEVLVDWGFDPAGIDMLRSGGAIT